MRIPNVTSRPIQDDGSMNRDWFQYLQSLGNSVLQLFCNTSLTASIATVYSAPQNAVSVISSAFLTNTTGSAVTVSVYVVPSGGTAGAGNVVINARSIAAGSSYACPELIGKSLPKGSTVQAVGNGVSIVISGMVNQ